MATILSFYSYKGGVGRSMALANIGTLLAKWGNKVLLVDLDLEAPGLEQFFEQREELEREGVTISFKSNRIGNAQGMIDLLGVAFGEVQSLNMLPKWSDL